MRKILIIVLIIVIVLVGLGVYLLLASKNNTTANNTVVATSSSAGNLPAISVVTNESSTGAGGDGSDLPDYIGQASDVYGSLPTGSLLQIGTAQGIVQVNNFYAKNPAVVDGGTLIIKTTPNYILTYDPASSAFWIAITGTSFSTWETPAEQDLVQTLGISQSDACKLDVTEGVVYSPGNGMDGQSVKLSFCGGSIGGNAFKPK